MRLTDEFIHPSHTAAKVCLQLRVDKRLELTQLPSTIYVLALQLPSR